MMPRTTLPARFTRWDPFQHLQDLRREMDLLFDRTLGRDVSVAGGNGPTLAWLPEADFVDEDKHYVVRMDLPGLDRDDVEITLASNVLTIQGERKTEAERKDENVQVSERTYGRFLRRFNLLQEVDADHVDAKMKKGVLEIRLNKLAESKTRKITIQG